MTKKKRSAMTDEMLRRMENALHVAGIENGPTLREAARAALDVGYEIFVWPQDTEEVPND